MSTLKSYVKGEIISKEGDKAKSLFIIVEGKVGIYKNENKIAEFDKEGTIVGEMSLILKKPRSATIKAMTDARLLEISGEIEDIVKQYPDTSKKIIKSLAERLAKNTEDYGITKKI